MEEGMHISFLHNIISNVISSSGLSTIFLGWLTAC